MSILDKAKATAERARGQAKRGVAQGRAQLNEVQARRQHGKLVRQLGAACYAEHSGEGAHEAVAAAFAAVDAHAQAHPPARAPGRPQAVRQARGHHAPGSGVHRRGRQHRGCRDEDARSWCRLAA